MINVLTNCKQKVRLATHLHKNKNVIIHLSIVTIQVADEFRGGEPERWTTTDLSTQFLTHLWTKWTPAKDDRPSHESQSKNMCKNCKMYAFAGIVLHSKVINVVLCATADFRTN